MGTAIMKLLCVHASICLSSLLCTTFEYCTLPAQATYIGTPLCRRATCKNTRI